jgi:hypothetical protein
LRKHVLKLVTRIVDVADTSSLLAIFTCVRELNTSM